jgi:hypothetical protein
MLLTSAGLSIIIVLLSIIVSVAGTWAVYGWRIRDMETRLKNIDATLTEHNICIIRNEETVLWIKEALCRIESKLNNMVSEDSCGERRTQLSESIHIISKV